MAQVLADDHLEAIRGPAGAFRLVDVEGDLIGVPTGFGEWFWSPIRQAYFWTPLVARGTVNIRIPPTVVTYFPDMASCRLTEAYLDPAITDVGLWPNPVMISAASNAGESIMIYDRSNPVETVTVGATIAAGAVFTGCQALDPPQEMQLIRLFEAPYLNEHYEAPPRLEPGVFP